MSMLAVDETQVIWRHRNEMYAALGQNGERTVLLKIGRPDDQDPPVFAFRLEDARELAQHLLAMADTAERLDGARSPN